jgi:hypothetical protein
MPRGLAAARLALRHDAGKADPARVLELLETAGDLDDLRIRRCTGDLVGFVVGRRCGADSPLEQELRATGYDWPQIIVARSLAAEEIEHQLLDRLVRGQPSSVTALADQAEALTRSGLG